MACGAYKIGIRISIGLTACIGTIDSLILRLNDEKGGAIGVRVFGHVHHVIFALILIPIGRLEQQRYIELLDLARIGKGYHRRGVVLQAECEYRFVILVYDAYLVCILVGRMRLAYGEAW